ncbi:hypothetical protein FRC08_011329 [Ceratobasidium sp. 394]|nr:hypothetical protein FRC08_011329 [Ceratobasidium sp. 394]KAG9092155.1 hypothetical protein FS749_015955 [Ceratobasidium sp. UAMH 11750]
MPGAKSNTKPGATVPITDHHDAQPNPDQLLVLVTNIAHSETHNAPDTVEQPALAKKQTATTKEATTKAGKTAGANSATNCTDSWSASYHKQVACLPPPPAPKKTKKKAANPPPQPTPSPSEASAFQPIDFRQQTPPLPPYVPPSSY